MPLSGSFGSALLVGDLEVTRNVFNFFLVFLDFALFLFVVCLNGLISGFSHLSVLTFLL